MCVCGGGGSTATLLPLQPHLVFVGREEEKGQDSVVTKGVLGLERSHVG